MIGRAINVARACAAVLFGGAFMALAVASETPFWVALIIASLSADLLFLGGHKDGPCGWYISSKSR